jgi:hypothetical protein
VFSKKDVDNINPKQLQELKLLAQALLNMKAADIQKALKIGALEEVIRDEKNNEKDNAGKDK